MAVPQRNRRSKPPPTSAVAAGQSPPHGAYLPSLDSSVSLLISCALVKTGEARLAHGCYRITTRPAVLHGRRSVSDPSSRKNNTNPKDQREPPRQPRPDWRLRPKIPFVHGFIHCGLEHECVYACEQNQAHFQPECAIFINLDSF